MHGGAGAWRTDDAALAAELEEALRAALAAGWRVLAGGGPAREAAVAAVCVLEDCPRMNAGRGSVLAADGTLEMDAGVADGATGRAGGAAGLRRLRHPVLAARAVLERSGHVLLAGPGAERFAAEAGLERVDPDWLVTRERRVAHAGRGRGDAAPGTVGCVARDADGHLAAATSTGGLPGKRPGRVSDSCVPGAGTWADDRTCAVSGTGDGDAFLRCAFAHVVHAERAAGRELAAACARALDAAEAAGGTGGCAAVDRGGALHLPFRTPAMPRGWIAADGAVHVALAPGPDPA